MRTLPQHVTRLDLRSATATARRLPSLVVLVLVSLLALSADRASAQIVISQVYADGGSYFSTYSHDYVELFNRGVTSVNVTGWSVAFKQYGFESWKQTYLFGTIPPGRYFLVKLDGSSVWGTPLPFADATGYTDIKTSGSVAVADSGNIIRDLVGYGIAPPNYEGSAYISTLSDGSALYRRSGGCLDTDYNGLDFTKNNPAPFNSLSPANYCTVVPPTCTYTVSPLDLSGPAAGGGGTVTVTTQTGCTWTAVSNIGWATITSGTPGSGSGTVGFSTPANPSTSSRSGTLTVAGYTVTLTQAGATPAPVGLSVSKTGNGSGVVSSNPAGISCGLTCLTTFAVNTQVTLSAVADAGSSFSGWSGACTGTGACVVTLDQAKSVTATFSAVAVTHLLTVSRSGNGTGTVSSTTPLNIINCGSGCSATLSAGSTVVLQAVPAAGSTFSGWSGACVGTGACTIAMNQAQSVSATFALTNVTHQLTVTKSGIGSGWVRSTSPAASIDCGSTCTASVQASSTVSLQAVAQPGSKFTGWSGGGCSGTGTCVVTMAQANSIDANFATAPIYSRYLAEGATSSFLDTRIALLNYGSSDSSATMTFSRIGAPAVTHALPVPKQSRVTIDPKVIAGLATAEFSTKVESDEPLIVDRTMSWDATGYGGHAETAVAAPSPIWYLAEGATHSGFDLFYLLQNPAPSQTTVRVRYLRPTGDPLIKDYVLPPNSRTNIWVNTETFPNQGAALAATDVSAVLESLDATPFIVERALYLSSQGKVFNAGHEAAGVIAPALQWFLAEGATGPYFDLFVLIANPNDQEAHVKVTYLLTTGQTYSRTFVAPPNSRSNVWVDVEQFDGVPGFPLQDVAVSTTVSSENSVPVIVERSLWWPGDFATWNEAHVSAGATQTGIKWALAEGEVAGPRGEETYILIANTSTYAGTARVTLYFEDGTSTYRDYPLPAQSRNNAAIEADFGAAVHGKRFGAVVESLGAPRAQIVVERAMYWNSGTTTWAAGTNALATKLDSPLTAEGQPLAVYCDDFAADSVCNVQMAWPFPYDGFAVIQQLANDMRNDLRDSCTETGGNNNFLFEAVRRLRASTASNRWGLNIKRGNQGLSPDIVSYFYGPEGAVMEGDHRVYLFDIIGGLCGNNPGPNFEDVTEKTRLGGTIGRWTAYGQVF